jgi:hypothetical protein
LILLPGNLQAATASFKLIINSERRSSMEFTKENSTIGNNGAVSAITITGGGGQ